MSMCLIVRKFAFGALVSAAALAAGADTNDLVTARRALGDGLWEIALRRAEAAERADAALAAEARLVQLEALARAGRDADILARLDAWAPSDTDEPLRFWRARALVRTGQAAAARALLAAPFTQPPFNALARTLAARLALADGDRAAAFDHFAAAAKLLAADAPARAVNACAWARAHDDAGDLKSALAVLKSQKAAEAPGPEGAAARAFAADLAARADLARSEEAWRAGRTAEALATASNALAAAAAPATARRAGFTLGFQELATPALHSNGLARVAALVREAPGDPASRAAQLRLADELLRLDDPAGALAAYNLLLRAYPEHALDAHVLEGRGWAFHRLGRFTEAVGAFARAVQVATNDLDRARCALKHGDELAVAGRFAEAANVYAAVTHAAYAEQAAFSRADALARDSREEDAERAFRAVLEAGGRFAVKAGLRLAAAESRAGRTEKAIADYNRVLGVKTETLTAEPDEDAPVQAAAALPPLPPLTPAERAEALLGRGRACYRAYRFDEAEKDFAAVAGLQPARAHEMRFLTALCRYGAGRDDDASAVARALLAETPPGPLRADLVLWLAKFDFARRDFASARTNFTAYAEAPQAAPARRLEALVRAARCARAEGEQQLVVDLASRVLAGAPAPAALPEAPAPVTAAVAEAMILQGEALTELARFDEAVLVLERAARLNAPGALRRQAAVLKADCLFAMGADNARRYEESLEAYRAVLQDETLGASARLAVSFKIGRALEKLGPARVEDAMDQYYANVVMAFVDGRARREGFDSPARAFFARAVFILADLYEAGGEDLKAAHVLDYLVKSGEPAADEARKRIARLKKKGGSL